MQKEEFSLFIKATLQIYRECAVLATKGLIKNWIIIFATVAAFFVFLVTAKLFMGLGIVGGFVVGLVGSALISLYYSWISDTIERDKLTYSNILNFDVNLFFAVISVSFLLFIINYLASPLQTAETAAIVIVVKLLIALLLNALPETVYIHRYESIQAVTSAATFTKENWIEWYLPFLLVLLPWLVLSGNPVAVLFEYIFYSPLLPTIILLQGWSSVVPGLGYFGLLLGLLVANWYMLFRGFLFKELESGSRRRRIYTARQK